MLTTHKDGTEVKSQANLASQAATPVGGIWVLTMESIMKKK
jgi:hypothetical protein